MEERRFDAWTRTLGAATSRRQLLKGALGGVLAAVVGRTTEPSLAGAASVPCSGGRKCERQAEQRSASCFNDCVQSLNSCMGGGGIAATPCFLTWHQCSANCEESLRTDHQSCRESGCLADDTCCNGACVNVFSGDPSNCGACGHVCPSGAQCINSQCICASDETVCNERCVNLDDDPFNCGSCGHRCDLDKACIDGQCSCDESQTRCGDTCVDTQSDNNNCGGCGHVCGDCEQCVAGTCQPLTCDSDRFCCQHACYPKCEHNQPNPATCQCGFCDALEDGTPCGPTSLCCRYQCLDTTCPDDREFSTNTCQCECAPVTCPSGKSQDPTTCQCICDPVDCPAGESQDPDTCQCADKCANVTCGECQTCDQKSGDCVNTDAGSACSSGVCCNGQCLDACPSGKHLDPGSCQCVNDCLPPQGGCGRTQSWDSITCQCVDYCGYMCEPKGEICCTDSGGYAYCCYSNQVCCNNPLGCCYPT